MVKTLFDLLCENMGLEYDVIAIIPDKALNEIAVIRYGTQYAVIRGNRCGYRVVSFGLSQKVALKLATRLARW